MQGTMTKDKMDVAANQRQAGRLQFIDNIRWALIVLVIFHHSAVTYGHIGSWYYNQDPVPGVGTTLILATFLAFNQAYFMGFLFLIAGYFVAPAFDRKGFNTFMRDRAIRLGLPSLFFMLVIHPLTVYWLLRDLYQHSRPSLWQAYPAFITSGRVLSASGPMWFALALLLFCVIYALWRLIASKPADASVNARAPLPSHRHVIALAICLAVTGFLVKVVEPVGATVLNMQLGNFPQYIALFAVGTAAYRNNWLLRIPYRFGLYWMGLALTAGLALWVLVILSSGVMKGEPPTRMFGGWHWQSALYCIWESLVCLGMSLGVLVLFRDKLRVPPLLAGFMTRNAFAAYMFHTPLLVAVTLALRPLPAPHLVKFALAGLVTVPITFLSSEFVFRRIPLLKEIL